MSEVSGFDPFANLTNVELEDVVIKTLFVRPEIGNLVFPHLTKNMMQTPQNGEIVEAVKSFYSTYSRYPTVRELFDLHIKAEDVKSKLKDLGSVKIGNYKEDILYKKIEEFIQLRKTFNLFIKGATAIKTTNNVDAIDYKLIEDLRLASNFTIRSNDGLDINDGMSSFVEYLNRKTAFVPTFSKVLNQYFSGGYSSGAVTVWYGESNIGKSTYLCNDAAFGFSQGYDVLYVTLELNKYEVLKKIMANLTGIPVSQLGLHSEEYFTNALKKISQSNIVILEYEAWTISSFDIQNTINDMITKNGFRPHIVFIDDINSMSSTKKSQEGKGHEDLGYVTKELENLAKYYDIPVVTCSQFNRSGYNTTKHSGVNVGESIKIFQKSANGIAISRDDLMIQRGMYELNIIKNRYGPKNISCYVKGVPDTMKFTDANNDDIAEIRDSSDDEKKLLQSDARSLR